MFGIDTTFYDVDQVTAKITAEIAKNIPVRTKIHKFKVVYSTPKVESGRRNIRTKTYAIDCH